MLRLAKFHNQDFSSKIETDPYLVEALRLMLSRKRNLLEFSAKEVQTGHKLWAFNYRLAKNIPAFRSDYPGILVSLFSFDTDLDFSERNITKIAEKSSTLIIKSNLKQLSDNISEARGIVSRRGLNIQLVVPVACSWGQIGQEFENARKDLFSSLINMGKSDEQKCFEKQLNQQIAALNYVNSIKKIKPPVKYLAQITAVEEVLSDDIASYSYYHKEKMYLIPSHDQLGNFLIIDIMSNR